MTIMLLDLIKNPNLLNEIRGIDKNRKSLERCINCGHGRLKQIPNTYIYQCDQSCGHREHYPPVESEPTDFGIGRGRVGRGCVAGD